MERQALRRGALNFSDGHARQPLQRATRARLLAAHMRLIQEGRSDYLEAEASFLEMLGRHTGQSYSEGNCRIVYSASVGLTIVAKHLALLGVRVGLVSPTFDCIPSLLRREGIHLVPVPEHRLMPDLDEDYVAGLALGALVVVVPGNPTGRRWDRAAFADALRWAAGARVELILDMSFRMLEPNTCWDVVAMAEAIGVDVIVLDDTGKTIPMYDSKIGVVSATARLAGVIGELCDELLLAVSEVDLRLIAAAMDADAPDNEVASARRLLRANSAKVRETLPASTWTGTLPLSGYEATPGVAWLALGDARDAVLERCRRQGLEILPGDGFYWDDTGLRRGADHVRLPLLRSTRDVEQAVRIIGDAIQGE